MSDFNIRGITTSARRPSVGAYAEVRYRPAGKLELYTGLFAAKVELPNRADAMIVYYAVARSSLGSLFLDIGGWYIDYPGGTLFNGVGSAATCTNGAFFFGQSNVSNCKLLGSLCEAHAYHQRRARDQRHGLLLPVMGQYWCVRYLRSPECKGYGT
jgi:hypothetical protein